MAGNSLRLQVILDTLDRASGPLKRILQGSKGLSKQLRDTTGKLRQMEAAQASLGKHRELETQTANTSAELTKQRRQLQAMQSAYAAAEAPSLKMTRALAKQADVVGKLDRKQQAQRTELTRSGAALSAAGYQVGRLGTHQRQLTSDIANANAELAEQRQRLERIGQVQRRNARIHSAGMKASLHGAGMVAGGMVAARASLKPAQAFAEQETAAVQLRAASMGATGQVSAGYDQMLAKAQELGNKLPGTTAELIEMFTMLRRQGMSEKTILGGLGESAAYLGAQLRMPYTEAAEFAAKLQDATGASEREMLKLSDTIQRTFYLGVESDNMLAGFSKLSPALSILRKRGAEAADELAPLLVMADQANLLGESAGNAFRKVFQYSMDAGKVGKANALMKGSGIKLDFTDGKGEFAGLDAMYKQLEKLRGLNTQDRLAVLRKLYGDDAETLQAVSMMIDKGKAGYLEVQAKMRAQASLQARVNASLGTLSNLWEAATGTFTNVLATFGGAAAPELKGLVTWAGNLAAKFQVWAAANPRLSKSLALLAIGGAALMVVLGGLLMAGGMAAMAFMQMHTALTVLTAGRGLAVAGPMLARVASLAGGLGRAVLMLGRFLLMTPIGLALSGIALAGYMVWKNWDGIKGRAILLWQDISTAAVRAWDWMKAKVATLGAAFSGAWTLVTALVSSWPNRLMDLGRNMVQGLVNGITGMGGAVKDALGGIANGAVTRLKNLLGIRSPSRVFAMLGGHTMAGFTQGLLGGQGGAQAALRRIGTGLRATGAGVALGAASAATASPALQARIDNRAPLGMAAGSGGPRVIEHRTYEIKIDAAGGDARAIKDAVRQAIEDLENERRVRHRSALSDYD